VTIRPDFCSAAPPQPTGRLTLEAADRAPALEQVVKAFAKETRQRYMDPLAELGIMALHLAVERSGGAAALPPDPFRRALFVVNAWGPRSTRAKLLDGYSNPARGALSGTIFSNCGYNIAGSLMARSQSIRGAVLTFGATPGWDVQSQALIGAFLARRRADWLALATLDEERVELSWFAGESL
jgi:hypothetical protein